VKERRHTRQGYGHLHSRKNIGTRRETHGCRTPQFHRHRIPLTIDTKVVERHRDHGIGSLARSGERLASTRTFFNLGDPFDSGASGSVTCCSIGRERSGLNSSHREN